MSVAAPREPQSKLPGHVATKHDLHNRLRRIEGQVRGIQAMIATDRSCIDTLDQIAAVEAALEKVALGVAERHVEHCIQAAASDPELRQRMTQELMVALARLA